MIHLNQDYGEPASALAQWLWQWSWQTSVVVGSVLLVRWACFRGALLRWRSALWLIVLVKMVMPFEISSGMSVFNLVRWSIRKNQSNLATMLPSAQPGTLASVSKPRVTIHYGAPPMDLASQAVEASPPPAPSHGLPNALVLAWFFGTAILLIGTAWSQVRFVRRLHKLPATEDPHLLAALQDGVEWLGIRHRPPIILTDAVSAPAIIGVMKPKLLLPPDTAESLTPTQLRNVLLHELAHLKRHDLQVDVLCVIIRALQWFNPLVWLALALYRSDREIARDAMALRYAPVPVAKDYGNTIVVLIERIAGTVTLPAGSLGILESHRNVRQRVIAVTEHRFRRIGWARAAVALLLVLALGAAALTGCRKDDPQSADNNVSHRSGLAAKDVVDANSAARAALQSHIDEIAIDAYTLTEAVEQLSAKTGQTIVIEAAAVNVAMMRHYQLKTKDSTLERVLWLILSDAGGDQARLNFAIIHGTITVSTDDDLKRATAETRVYDIRDLLVDIPDFNDAPSLSGLPATKPSPPNATDKPLTRDEKMGLILKLLRDTVDPESWTQYATIRDQSQQLIVYQTPENHQAISSLLQKLRESRGIQITVEARFVNVDLDALLEESHKKGGLNIPRWGGTFLDDQQVKDLLAMVEKAGDSSVLTAPRITLFNGQRAYLLVGEQEKYTSGFKELRSLDGRSSYQPEWTELHPGVLFDCQATASSDRAYATLTLRAETSKLQAMTCERWKGSPPGRDDLIVQVPQLAAKSLRTTVSVPTNGTLVMVLSPDSTPHGPSTASTHHVQTLLLVRPTIIIQRETGSQKK